MIVLVANLGSTSFKSKLFDIDRNDARVIAVAGADRIGVGNSTWQVAVGDREDGGVADLADHAAAIELHLEGMMSLGAMASLDTVEAVGFKAVHGGDTLGAVRVDEDVLATMARFNAAAPQHNPPYIAAMRAFMKKLPAVPQVAAFETGYHQTIPAARQAYGVPQVWMNEHGVRRYGFHGASHRYIATRMQEVAPACRRLISCHLGGSCSLCAIRDGRSEANSFGMTAQSGIFHSSRVGDLDTFALQCLVNAGIDIDEVWQRLGHEAGLKGLSGVSSDMREVEQAAATGNRQAALAVAAFVESCRHYLGAYLAVLNGADAVVFTGGIGQHGAAIRAAICADMDFAGIRIDPVANEAVDGGKESRISEADASVEVWVLPTNEELIVAQQTMEVLSTPAAAERT